MEAEPESRWVKSQPTRASTQVQASEAPVLSGISFTSLAGRTTAVVGSTGSGKTTLVNLIARLVDVTCGGADTGDYTAEQYPGVAPQLEALSGYPD